MTNYYYVRINNDINGNPRFLINLNDQEAKKLKAKKATTKQSQTLYITSVDGVKDIYMGYIIISYNIEEEIKNILCSKN